MLRSISVPPIFKFILRRMMGMLPILALVLVVTFLAAHALPGDPVQVMLSDHSANLQMALRLRAQYGLDQPLWRQFIAYAAGVLHGDFGLSFLRVGVPVTEVLREAVTISPLLALAALAVALPLGTLAGVLAAMRRNTWVDHTIIVVLVAGLSIPNFTIATFLVYGFALKLEILPVAGWGSLEQAVLPVVVLAIPSAAYIARLARTFMLEALQQDYIRTARAKGLRERLVIGRHALRNIAVPLMTSAGVIFGGLVSNAFVVETIFNIPGLGRIAIDSIFARDYPVTMAIVVLFTVFFLFINLAVDLGCVMVDPRLRARTLTS
jgi:ABC-type dipeptide/oligopeptide/nickel transport system permease component